MVPFCFCNCRFRQTAITLIWTFFGLIDPSDFEPQGETYMGQTLFVIWLVTMVIVVANLMVGIPILLE